MGPNRSWPPRERLLRWGRNALIAGTLALMTLDGVPIVPGSWRTAISPIVRGLGIWQTHWALFSPDPDHQNHRLGAKLQYADGSTADWSSPDWRLQTDWQRFRTHRLSKYFDNIRDPGFAPAWPALTELIIRETAAQEHRSDRPTKIEVFVRDAEVADPRFHPWTPAAAPRPLENRWTLFETESP